MNFNACEICGAMAWSEVYRGAVRDGAYGAVREGAAVARCGGCGAERLAEECCTPDSFYESDEYRRKLRQDLDSESYYLTHDELQIHTLQSIWPVNLRHATVADVGCAAGSLLDHLRGYTAQQVAIEPYDVYRNSLVARGYSAYPYAADAACDWRGLINLAFSIQVIEHTQNPRIFLEQIRPLLAADGRLVISTPNRRDILFDLVPGDFPSFFYRVVHRWYFDAESLTNCAKMAGYDVVNVLHVHRYGMANALRWIRDCKPGGQTRLPGIEPLADTLWKGYVEQLGRADCIYLVLAPSAGSQ